MFTRMCNSFVFEIRNQQNHDEKSSKQTMCVLLVTKTSKTRWKTDILMDVLLGEILWNKLNQPDKQSFIYLLLYTGFRRCSFKHSYFLVFLVGETQFIQYTVIRSSPLTHCKPIFHPKSFFCSSNLCCFFFF